MGGFLSKLFGADLNSADLVVNLDMTSENNPEIGLAYVVRNGVGDVEGIDQEQLNSYAGSNLYDLSEFSIANVEGMQKRFAGDMADLIAGEKPMALLAIGIDPENPTATANNVQVAAMLPIVQEVLDEANINLRQLRNNAAGSDDLELTAPVDVAEAQIAYLESYIDNAQQIPLLGDYVSGMFQHISEGGGDLTLLSAEQSGTILEALNAPAKDYGADPVYGLDNEYQQANQ